MWNEGYTVRPVSVLDLTLIKQNVSKLRLPILISSVRELLSIK